MKIRKATKKDLQEIANIEFQSGFMDSLKDCIKMIEGILLDENVFVVTINKKIAGYISISNKGEIGFLAVDKKMRGRGFGNILIKRAVNFAKRNKLKHIFLDVRNNNLPAIYLYLKNGFLISEVNKKNGLCKLRLEKRL